MMRNFTYKILVAIVVFMAGIAGLNAQQQHYTLTVEISGDDNKKDGINRKVVSTNDGVNTYYHAITGSQVCVTPSVINSQSTNVVQYLLYYRTSSSSSPIELQPQEVDGKVVYFFDITKEDNNSEREECIYTFYAEVDGTPTNPFEATFFVYREPEISNFSLNPESTYCLINSSVNVSLACDVNIPWGNSVANKWYLGDTEVTSDVKNYTFNSSTPGSQDLKVTMTVPSPLDGTNWVEKEVSTTITVYPVPSVTAISSVRQYALLGDDSFGIELNCTSSDGIIPSVEWLVNGNRSGDFITPTVDNPLKATFTPSAAGQYEVSAVVTFKAPDKNELYKVTYGDDDDEETTITVYPVPSVTAISSVRQYALLGDDSFGIELNCTSSDGIIPSVEWLVNGNRSGDFITPAVDNPLKATFTPSAAGQYEVSAVVTFKAPNGSDLYTYGDDENLSTTITVYDVPSVSISAPSYALAGGEIPVSATIQNKDEELSVNVAWYINGQEDESLGNETTATFKPSSSGSCEVSAVVTFKAPNGSDLYTYGDDENLSTTITVYDKPTVNDCHTSESTESKIYATFVDIKLNLSGLINLDPNNIDGFQDNGWSVKWFADDKELEDAMFKPDRKKDYNIKAQISNNSNDPTNPWLEYSEEFMFHVYEKPQWKTNIDDVFEGDILHVASGDIVNIDVSLPNCVDGFQWNALCSVNGESPIDIKNSYKFSKTNDSEDEQSYIHSFVFSYKVPLLFNNKDVIDACKQSFDKTIVVWKEITANVDDSMALEMRVNDEGSQVIKFNVVGGDFDKWNISLESTDLPQGSWSTDKNNRMLKYSIANSKFSQNGNNKYQFKAVYKDGGMQEKSMTLTKRIDVYPEPTIAITLALNNKENVSYRENDGKYIITCYKDDEIMLTATPQGGKAESSDDYRNWKYKTGDTSTSFSKELTISQNQEITFINSLGDQEKYVKTISIEIDRKAPPTVSVNHELPDVAEENKGEIPNLWKNTSEDKRLDLYAGWEDLKLEFMPQNGYDEGWTYKWELGGNDVSYEKGFDYKLKDPTDSAEGYEDKVISFTYKNSIPESDYQKGENVGLEETKSYYVRVWRKAELPETITLKDDYNVDPDHINENKAIRVGNKLSLSVSKIKYGYNPQEEGSYNEYTLKENDREQEIDSQDPDTLKYVIGGVVNDKPDNGLASGKNTYKFSFSNKGPRDIPWEKDSITETITVYNRPKTPSSLIRKGNGNSGTLIITYHDYEGKVLPVPEDYSIVFRYIDADGNTESRESKANDKRWITTGLNLTDDMMEGAYAFSRFNYTRDNGGEQNVRITSGRIKDGEIDESWDESEYNLTDEQMAEARARTRAGGGDYTAIQSVESEEEMVSVYNTSGVKVATSTENLKPGIYIIRSMQNGEMNSKKLSVK